MKQYYENTIFIFLFVLIALNVVLYWYAQKHLFYYAGPFHGQLVSQKPEIMPTQVFNIEKNKQLKVYNTTQQTNAPTVCFFYKNKKKWCIKAFAHKYNNIASIRFKNLSKFPFLPTKIEGKVKWNYGKNSTVWYLDDKGNLLNYYYSW